jgi:hypothetical protein
MINAWDRTGGRALARAGSKPDASADRVQFLQLPVLNAWQFSNVPVGRDPLPLVVAPHRDSSAGSLASRAHGATGFYRQHCLATLSSMPMARVIPAAERFRHGDARPCGSEAVSVSRRSLPARQARRRFGLLQVTNATTRGRVINDPAIRGGAMDFHVPRKLS